MNKEMTAEIGRAIGDAQKAKNLKEQQVAAEKKAESLRQEAEKKALVIQNEARLRATGVVALFEELRDSRVLAMPGKRGPAVIKWGEFNKSQIRIEFDGDFEEGNYGGEVQWNFRPKALVAAFSESGILQIGQHEMRPGEELGEVVKNEILRLKGLKKE